MPPPFSRAERSLLDAIGDPYDLTLVRTPGNLGDALIAAGTAELLADHVYREVDLEGLCSAEGDTVVLQGSGAFCRPYHEVMPRALAVAELRFRRVLVLPSSFDTAEETVRDALARSRAIVFARERVIREQARIPVRRAVGPRLRVLLRPRPVAA